MSSTTSSGGGHRVTCGRWLNDTVQYPFLNTRPVSPKHAQLSRKAEQPAPILCCRQPHTAPFQTQLHAPTLAPSNRRPHPLANLNRRPAWLKQPAPVLRRGQPHRPPEGVGRPHIVHQQMLAVQRVPQAHTVVLATCYPMQAIWCGQNASHACSCWWEGLRNRRGGMVKRAYAWLCL